MPFEQPKQEINEPRREQNLSSGFPTRSDKNRTIQPQKMARLNIYDVEERLYYICSENKGADHLRDYRAAYLRLYFSHDAVPNEGMVSSYTLMPSSNWSSYMFTLIQKVKIGHKKFMLL